MPLCRAGCRHLGVILAMVLPLPAAAQIRASERASVSQTIDGTVITVDYARPRVRGRNPIFGGVVHWKEVWTPGANWATTLEVSKDVQMDGHPLPKGKYSVWLVVEQEGWTMVLDSRHRRFHTNPPDSTAEQIRYPVKPGAGPATEVLTWSFPNVRADGAVLRMDWATTTVSFDIKVQPSHAVTIARSEVAGMLGRYSFAWAAPDTSKPLTMTLSHENGMLMARLDPAPDPMFGSFALIRIAEDWFVPAILQDGQVYDVISDWVIEFARAGGRVTGFEVRGEGDKVEASGKRL